MLNDVAERGTVRDVLVIAVVNLKGGTSKTTSAAFLVHALHETGWSAWAVDADPQGSLLHWSGVADWPMPCLGMPERTLHTRLDGVIGGRADAVVIDPPPLEEQAGIVYSVLRRATHVLTPVAPTPIEYERLSPIRTALTEVAPLRADDRPPAHAVLLTRTVAGASSTEVYREQITDDGDHVLASSVGRLERFALAYGDPIAHAVNTAYGDAAVELLELDTQEAQ